MKGPLRVLESLRLIRRMHPDEIVDSHAADIRSALGMQLRFAFLPSSPRICGPRNIASPSSAFPSAGRSADLARSGGIYAFRSETLQIGDVAQEGGAWPHVRVVRLCPRLFIRE